MRQSQGTILRMSGESAFDGPLAMTTIEGSQIAESGVATFNTRERPEGEASTGDGAYAGLGLGGRPLPQGDDGAAEAVCARASSGMPLLGARDLRIETAREDPPGPGTIYLAGYHGAELRFDVPSEGVSTTTLRDSTGKAMVLDGQGVRVPDADFIQGDPSLARDVLLAQPAIDLIVELGPIVLALAAAVNGLAPGSVTPTQITNLTAKLAPYLVPGSPAAPTTRAPKLRGAPGA